MLKQLFGFFKRFASNLKRVVTDIFYAVVGRAADMYYSVTSITSEGVGRELKRSIKRASVGFMAGQVSKILPTKAVDFLDKRVSLPCEGINGTKDGVKIWFRDFVGTMVSNLLGKRPEGVVLSINM